MAPSSLFLSGAALSLLFSVFITSVSATSAKYVLEQDYSGDSFFDGFTFLSDADPTFGFVEYVDQTTAITNGLVATSEGVSYLGVDSSIILDPNGPGRQSVRIQTKETFTQGLFLLDASNMPGGVCGTWPAFWSYGPDWPVGGAIDIIEGVNSNTVNTMSMQTAPNCTISPSIFSETGTLQNTNCDVVATQGVGCGVTAVEANSYGTGFNENGGGVYATEWTDQYIRIWFFPRGSISEDITEGKPDPSTWGAPVTNFQGDCDMDSHFWEHKFVLNTDFCGDWAGAVWAQDSVCSAYAPTCEDYVADNPEAFQNMYWAINSFKVYKKPAVASSSSSIIQSSTSSSLSSSSSTACSTTTASSSSYFSSTTVSTSIPSGTSLSSTMVSISSSSFSSDSSTSSILSTATSSSIISSSSLLSSSTVLSSTPFSSVTSQTTSASSSDAPSSSSSSSTFASPTKSSSSPSSSTSTSFSASETSTSEFFTFSSTSSTASSIPSSASVSETSTLESFTLSSTSSTASSIRTSSSLSSTSYISSPSTSLSSSTDIDTLSSTSTYSLPTPSSSYTSASATSASHSSSTSCSSAEFPHSTSTSDVSSKSTSCSSSKGASTSIYTSTPSSAYSISSLSTLSTISTYPASSLTTSYAPIATSITGYTTVIETTYTSLCPEGTLKAYTTSQTQTLYPSASISINPSISMVEKTTTLGNGKSVTLTIPYSYPTISAAVVATSNSIGSERVGSVSGYASVSSAKGYPVSAISSATAQGSVTSIVSGHGSGTATATATVKGTLYTISYPSASVSASSSPLAASGAGRMGVSALLGMVVVVGFGFVVVL